MNFIVKMLISTLAVMLTAYFMSSVHIDGDTQNQFLTALLVAVVLAFLNAVVRPILTVLSMPITFFTLGLFLLVINAAMILLAQKLVPGFHVDGFWSALWFSIILAVVNSVLNGLKGKEEVRE